MSTTTYDIKEFQKKLPNIMADMARSGGFTVVTTDQKPSMVAITYHEYEELLELKEEVSSDSLKKDIRKGRHEYDQGITRDFSKFRSPPKLNGTTNILIP